MADAIAGNGIGGSQTSTSHDGPRGDACRNDGHDVSVCQHNAAKSSVRGASAGFDTHPPPHPFVPSNATRVPFVDPSARVPHHQPVCHGLGPCP